MLPTAVAVHPIAYSGRPTAYGLLQQQCRCCCLLQIVIADRLPLGASMELNSNRPSPRRLARDSNHGRVGSESGFFNHGGNFEMFTFDVILVLSCLDKEEEQKRASLFKSFPSHSKEKNRKEEEERMALEDRLLEGHGHRAEAEEDIEEITNCRQFMKQAVEENRKLWYLSGPAIFTSVAQYSLGAITQVFAGHLTTLELDAVSTENMVIAGLSFGVMLGMGSALETLCGQAFGAKQLHMMGVYMQRSWVILGITCICMLPIYIFATPILKFFGQNEDIAELAGTFALYMIPQLFAYGLNFPLQKFLQAQTVSLNLAWVVVVLGQFAYIAMGNCPGAWTGFSWGAFKDLGAFAWLSIASAIMLCLEFWYLTFLIVLAGRLKNAEIAVASISICTNLSGWEVMIFLGFNAAISVRISNELGAGRPRAAKFSILVVVLSSVLIGLFFFVLVLAMRDVYALPFTNSPAVAHAVSKLATIFSFTLLLNSVQPVLTGVAVGAGWQWLVAYVNIGCYYIFGLPLGFFLGDKLNLGVEGIWGGMITGIALQTAILIGITLSTNWNKEAMEAASRIRKWGGSVEPPMDGSKVVIP
ncbi:protein DETOXIFICATION 33-like protein [Cinnamomum micranthum f. kanehirae]|uniref:Protein DETOXIFICATION n=1 Tax=Cinnamomum micranthum f. kanehirae TaxID=337451 RepID=A0A3S3NHI0_9MAGN|nr:protein DETOXIFICATION 33-like protein [Cinnamomum micranthum f. kanehirae]